MKNCLTYLLVIVVLAALLVGGLYIYVQQETIKQQSQSHYKTTSKARKKTREISKKVKKLSQDFDKDGLTKAEEDKLGTSDYSKDTDHDGIPDPYDIVPKGKGRNVVKFLEWKYGSPWKWEVMIPIDVLSYYEKVKRPRWKGDYSYYAEFIDANDSGIQQLAFGLKEAISKKDNKAKPWTYYEEVMFIVKLVQSLRYTDDKLTGFDDYTKYPMQTVNDGTGDCEDLAILCAALLHKLEYDVKLVHFDQTDGPLAHLGLAVWGENLKKPFWKKGGRDYYYVETTNNAFGFGEMPEEWSGTNIKSTLIDIK